MSDSNDETLCNSAQGTCAVMAARWRFDHVRGRSTRISPFLNIFIGRFKKFGLIEKNDGVLEVRPILARLAEGATELSQTEHPPGWRGRYGACRG
jgi:hypothetical protein